MLKRYLIILFLCSPFSALADHIFGGYILFKTVNPNTGQYYVELNIYMDVPRMLTGALDYYRNNASYLTIFRKSDNARMDRVYTLFDKTRNIIFANTACAQQRNFQIMDLTLSNTVTLDPSKYTDPGGYYIVYDVCCRNLDVKNIENPQSTGILFYSEFPALVENGRNISYSTPEVPPLNGDYICLNRPFKYDFSANDADGDQMKYNLGNPIVGKAAPYNALPDTTQPGPYKSVTWSNGYSTNVQIKGNPNLSINTNTGELSVKANTLGLFVFSVEIVDYRNGKRMGMIKHDFQLPVVNCNYTTAPFPVVKNNGVAVTEVDFCPGETVTLSTDDDPNWAFQWQKNGNNISNANTATLITTEFGDYTVVKSLKTTCANDTISSVIKLQKAVPTPAILATTTNLCNNASITLSVNNPNLNFIYTWKNGTTSLGNANSLIVNTVGWYYLYADKTTGNCLSSPDSIYVSKSTSAPLLDPLASYSGCVGDSVLLETSTINNATYQWHLNGTDIANAKLPTFYAKNSGQYMVTVTDANQCSTDSKIYFVNITNSLNIVIDPVKTLCAAKGNQINLNASPTGGIFSGPGVANNIFDPMVSGMGTFNITYKYGSGSCSSSKSFPISVVAAFNLTINPTVQNIKLGQTATVTTVTDAISPTYHWIPELNVDDHHSPDPNFSPTSTTVYTLTTTSSTGCTLSESITIIVAEPNDISIPNAFTPNNDGINDKLEIFSNDIKNISTAVYDRWGEIIYISNSLSEIWNGGYGNNLSKPCPSGVYEMRIKAEFKSGKSTNLVRPITLIR